MILLSGRFCLIRDKFVRDDGHLVVIAHYWLSEADQKANPKQPRAAYDHLIVARAPIVADDPHVADCIGTIFAGVDVANETYSPPSGGHSRGTRDPFGWLAHPFLARLEVTPEQ